MISEEGRGRMASVPLYRIDRVMPEGKTNGGDDRDMSIGMESDIDRKNNDKIPFHFLKYGWLLSKQKNAYFCSR